MGGVGGDFDLLDGIDPFARLSGQVVSFEEWGTANRLAEF
jgi:hypothetical protein